jgi:integrase
MVQNLEVYASVKRWLSKLEARSDSLSTKKSGLLWLREFCNFAKTNPDSLIRDRTDNLESKEQGIRRKHEELLEAFIIQMKNDGYAPNSVSTASGMIRSFFKSNYVTLQEVRSPRPYNIKPYKVPTIKDIKKMCEHADLSTRTWMVCAKDSGLGNADLLPLTLSNLSSEYGTIGMQLRKGIVPVHIELRRHKTKEVIHSFFGPNAIEALKEYVNINARGRIFRMSARSLQQKIKALSIQTKVATKEVPVRPYSYRKVFNTYMKLAGVNEAIVEVMMGHSIGRVRGAYLQTGSGSSGIGIPISKLVEAYMQAYPTIDINQA